MMLAGEIARVDGPWGNPDDVHRLNGVVRYSNGSYNNGFALTAMAYEGHWNATDQIPLYAVEAGILDRFGAIDPTDGGKSHRYSLSGRWHTTDAESATRINAYLVKSDLALFNNFRTQPTRAITSTLAAFILDFDSEVVFVGDAGTTEASRPSRRIGAEFTLQAEILPWLFLNLDAAYTQARFKDHSPDGRRIPGAIEGVVTAGLSFQDVWGGFFGGINVRYFGPRPLIEDNSVRSEASTPVSARLGYKFGDGLIVQVDAYNLFDETASQIDYFYESSFPSGAPPLEDIHFHPLEPRSFRLAITREW